MHWKKASVHPTYPCPLCDRGPRDYYTSTLLPQPICGACTDYLDMACLEDERPNDPEVDCLEGLVKMEWKEYRVALLRRNLATWREIEEDPQKESIQQYMKWSGWSEKETREYVRGVIRDLEESLKRAVGGSCSRMFSESPSTSEQANRAPQSCVSPSWLLMTATNSVLCSPMPSRNHRILKVSNHIYAQKGLLLE